MESNRVIQEIAIVKCVVVEMKSVLTKGLLSALRFLFLRIDWFCGGSYFVLIRFAQTWKREA